MGAAIHLVVDMSQEGDEKNNSDKRICENAQMRIPHDHPPLLLQGGSYQSWQKSLHERLTFNIAARTPNVIMTSAIEYRIYSVMTAGATLVSPPATLVSGLVCA
jgi:hypothetical protein